MEEVTLGIAFMAGIFSFLSPCILPLVPGYISFLSGMTLDEIKQDEGKKKLSTKAGVTAIFFVLGFSVVFIALGASATFIGKFFIQYIAILTKVAGVIIITLGLHLTGIINIKWLDYNRQIQIKKKAPGFTGAFLIGMAFALGWTPCIGPILASILAIAATKETALTGVLLLGAFSLGLGIPFIITGFAVGSFMKFFEKYKQFIKWIKLISGTLLLIVGILIFFDKLGTITNIVTYFLSER